MDDERWKYLSKNIARQKKDIFLDSDLYEDSLIQSGFGLANSNDDSITFDAIIENFKNVLNNPHVKDIISPKIIKTLIEINKEKDETYYKIEQIEKKNIRMQVKNKEEIISLKQIHEKKVKILESDFEKRIMQIDSERNQECIDYQKSEQKTSEAYEKSLITMEMLIREKENMTQKIKSQIFELDSQKKTHKEKIYNIKENFKIQESNTILEYKSQNDTDIKKLKEGFQLRLENLVAEHQKDIVKAKTEAINTGYEEIKDFQTKFETNKNDIKTLYNRQLQDKDAEQLSYKKQIENLKEKIQKNNEQFEKITQNELNNHESVKTNKKEISQLMIKLNEKDDEIATLEEKIEEEKSRTNDAKNYCTKKDQEMLENDKKYEQFLDQQEKVNNKKIEYAKQKLKEERDRELEFLMDKIYNEESEVKNRMKKEQEIIKMDIEKEIVIYEKKLKDLEKKCVDKEKSLEKFKDDIETVNLQWKSKMDILASENKNKTANYSNIIKKIELELETKNQHLVSLKRDLSNLHNKYNSVLIEKTQREEEVNML